MLEKLFSVLRNRRFVFGLTVVFLIMLYSIIGLFINYELNRLEEKAKQSAQTKLVELSTRLEGAIHSNTLILRVLEAYVLLHKDYDHDVIVKLINNFQKYNPGIRHIAVAPNLKVDLVYPLQGNEQIINLDYRSDSVRYETVQQAVNAQDIIVRGPIELVQGGTAIMAWSPIFFPDSELGLWGVITGVFHEQVLLDSAGLNKGLEGFNIAIRNRDHKTGAWKVFYGLQSTFEEEAVINQIKVTDSLWEVAIIPADGWRADKRQSLMFILVGIVVSILFSLVAYFLVSIYKEKVLAIKVATHRANYDVLTGLFNRYYFSQLLDVVIVEHQKGSQQFALLYLNVDFFKEVNDEWGNHVGDELLFRFAERIKQNVRHDDLVARIAGDEFIIVLQNTHSGSEVEWMIEKLKKELTEPYYISRQYISITHSMGVAMFPEDGLTQDLLLQNANRAMHQSKREGKNRVTFFNHKLNEELQNHVQVHNQIIKGIKNNEFEMYFQPIMDLSSGKITKCEALIRWNHPEKGMVSPFHFISIAEQTGAIIALGNWILEKCCHLHSRLQALGINIYMSVNRSVVEFTPVDAHSNWLEVLRDYSIKPKDMVFEITESLLMDGQDSQLDKIHHLRDQGIAFSIDDFGTGYSALNYLRNYPIDYLKIDQSFIRDILKDEQDRTLVEVIIKMGKTLGITVVAEGVEEAEQLALLKEFGCDYAQGYLLGKPMPYEAFVNLLKKQEDSTLVS